ncbi:MAG: hypothetical protein BGO29_03420 [Bacteroidales bacterium 36-12]|nr:MAG: hypothetical protein BGO29_03420 [Bacteroidales bacterium 36-12]
MDELINILPKELFSFILTALFSLLIGLSQLKFQMKNDDEKGIVASFGTDRTFTFIGILGYILYILDPQNLILYIGGGIAMIALLSLNYISKALKHNMFGMTTILIALITYCLAPIIITQPLWFSLTIVVFVLMLTEMKSTFKQFANKMRNDELIILAKFLAISGVILPILPNNILIEGTQLTPYSIWLATVVVSGISYASYLLKRYVFKKSGTFISGLIGGLYSSTATITLLAKEARGASEKGLAKYAGSMVIAKSMMFLKFLILIYIFSRDIFLLVYPYLIFLTIASTFIAWLLNRKSVQDDNKPSEEERENEDYKNPLEFKVALIFAGLFVFFTVITTYTLQNIGNSGLGILSLLSGVSDITPFVINLLQNATEINSNIVVISILLAMLSNTIVTIFYIYFFSGRRKDLQKKVLWSFLTIILLIGITALMIYLIY